MTLAVLSLPPAAATAAAAARGLRPALQVARRGTGHFRILVALILFALLVGPVQELAPAIAKDHGNGAHILGYLLGALAAGGLVGNFLIGRPTSTGPTGACCRASRASRSPSPWSCSHCRAAWRWRWWPCS
ncbi:MAG TPA: hypothetical protein VHR88_03265 [Solirubrobacteraceae bacterium]|jgi:hypothetical protein|nr:hypothetical protein [Solirubrobacteraceae bacterium]